MSTTNPSCPYCVKDEAMEKIGYAVATLSVSTVYLFREQSHPGRLIVAHEGHVAEISDLSLERLAAYFADVAAAVRAIKAVYNPDKINYGAYGDLMPHLHFHLVPKYRDGFEWGGIFAMNPQKTMLSDEECEPVAKKLREALGVK